MRAITPAVLSLIATIAPAHALQRPHPALPLDRGGDPHVQVAVYHPYEQILVVGAVNRPLTITFAPGEQIRHVNLETNSRGDGGKSIDAPWSGPPVGETSAAPLDNVLPLWAMREGRSNAQVITTRPDGSSRVYLFVLLSLPAQPDRCQRPDDDCDDPRLVNGLSFIYPDDQKAIVRQASAQTRQVAQRQAAEERLRTDIFYGDRNWRYIAKGTEAAKNALAPDEVSDNTQVTGFRYLGNRKEPAFYVIEADGSERQVSPVPNQDLDVIYETAYHWRLRKGDLVVDIYNLGYDPIGANPWTGTTSPNVIRTIRTTAAAPK
jgi:type IV secretion system protein VirB9